MNKYVSKAHNKYVREHVHSKEPRTILTYYWIVEVSNATGRSCIFGCKNSHQEAELEVAKLNNATCEIIPLNTKDSRLAHSKINEMRENGLL